MNWIHSYDYRPPGPATGAGIWWGTLRRRGETDSRASCLVTETGELACLLYEAVYTGTVIANDPVIGAFYPPETPSGGVYGTVDFADASDPRGAGRLYAAPGSVLSDGTSMVAEFAIIGGSLTNQNRNFELTISSLGEVSTLFAEFDYYYYLAHHSIIFPTLPGIFGPGVYVTFDMFGDQASFSIDPDGALFSQNSAGCVVNGQLSVINAEFNGYALDSTVSGCQGLNGSYAGLAFFIDYAFSNGTNDLRLAVFNDTRFIAGEARMHY